MEPISYRYSRVSSILFTLLCIGVVIASLSHLVRFFDIKSMTNAYLILAFDTYFTAVGIFVIIRYLIPALKRKVALELNAKGIVSWTKNVTIEWSDISSIELRGTKVSYLRIWFKYKTDHGQSIGISLGFVEGNDNEIYETVMSFFNHYKYNHA